MKVNIHGRTPVEIVWSTKSIENKRTKGGAENQCIRRDKDTVHFKRVCTRVYLSQNCLCNVVLNVLFISADVIKRWSHKRNFFYHIERANYSILLDLM